MSRMKEKMTTWTFHARVVAHKGWGLYGIYQPENNYKDRHGLLMWLLWSLRIIAFKLYFCSRKDVFKGFLSFRQPSTGRKGGMGMKEFFKFMRIAWWVFSCLRISRRLWKYGPKTKNIYCTKIATFRNNKKTS